MATKTINCTKDASVINAVGSSFEGWSGYDLHHPVGRFSSGSYDARSFLYFPISFTGMVTINSATLYLYGSHGATWHAYLTSGSTVMNVARMTSDWGEGTNRGENDWSSGESWNWTNRSNAISNSGVGSRTFTSLVDDTLYSIDITAIVQAWFTGSPNYGVRLYNETETNSARGLEFHSRHVSGKVPYVVIDYSTNIAPVAPVSLSPTADAITNTLSPNLVGTRSDPDSGDYITAFQIQLYEDNGTTLKWDSGTITTSGTPSTFSTTYAGPVLTGNSFYKWKARTRDKGAAWGPYSALQRFKANSAPVAPTVTLAETPVTDITTLNPTISITHNDPDPTDSKMYGYRVIIETSAGASVWDSGDISTSGTPVTTKTFIYSGPALSWGTSYRIRARTRDSNLVWGAYSTNLAFSTHKTGTPTSLDPSNNETIGGLQVTFTAARSQSNDTIQSYRIFLYQSDGATVVHDSGNQTSGISGTTVSYTYGTNLAYNTTYKWKIAFNVVSGNFGGQSDYTSLQTFLTPLDPTVPTQTAPKGTGISTLTPTFTGSRSSSTFTSYQIVIYNSDGITIKHDTGAIAVAATNNYSYVYNGSALSWGTQYRWKVRVNAGTYSGLTSFTTDAAGTPVLSTPIQGAWLESMSANQYANAVLTKSGLKAYYRMSDGSGTLTDELGTADGTLLGGYTLGQVGPITDDSTAILYGGTGYATVASTAPFDNGDVFSIIGWFKRTSTQSALQRLTSKGTNAPGIYLSSVNNVRLSKHGGGDAVISSITVTDTNWHFLAITKNGATAKIYIDGIDRTGTVTTLTMENTATLQHFARNANSSVDFFPGTMAHWAWFNRAISQQEVTDLYAAATSPNVFQGTSGSETMTHLQILVKKGTATMWDSGMVDITDGTSFARPYGGSALTGGEYTWTARYTKTGGIVGGYAPSASFRLNSSPTAPTNLSPSPGAIVANTTNPTFKATFTDADKVVGDIPASWVIEIRNSNTDAIIQTKTISTGLVAGENVYVWNTDVSDVDLTYGVDYKWTTYFVDSMGASGASSSFSAFRLGQAPTATITSPSGDINSPSVIATTSPTITWNYSDPQGYSQTRFSLSVYRASDGVRVYSIEQISSANSFKIPVGYLTNSKIYNVVLNVMNAEGIWSTTSGSGYMEVILNAPYPIEVFNTYIDEDKSRISLRWESTADKPGQTFSYYAIYRRPLASDFWNMIDKVHGKNVETFYDWTAGHGLTYEYKVTQFVETSDGTDLESPDSPELQATLDSDVWYFIGADRSDDHIFELPVVSEQHTRPVQSEIFEPLGGNRKVVVRGAVLGHEGSITVLYEAEDSWEGRAHIEHMIMHTGPHILKSPFGDVWFVECSTPNFGFQPTGPLEVEISWVEVGEGASEYHFSRSLQGYSGE